MPSADRRSPGGPSERQADRLVAEALRAGPPLPPLQAALGKAGEPRILWSRAFLEGARRRVRALHQAGASGVTVVGTWTRLVDHLIIALHSALTLEQEVGPGGVALLALGGYGRGELSPYSDLDLLVIHRGGEELGPLVEGLLYPLWDSGVDVQCLARTLQENVEVARTDLRTRTSLLEARILAGDPNEARAFDQMVIEGELFGRDVRGFVEGKLREMEARHRRYGDTVYLLEPNVKEGEGGLRDIQTALWVAKVRYRVRSSAELLHKGVLPPAEVSALEMARDFLLHVRNDLHFRAGRRDDRLSFEYQEDAAPFFGFSGDGEISAAEQFLQAYFECANRVGHFTEAVIRRATSGLLPSSRGRGKPSRRLAPGVRLQGGEVYLSPKTVRRHPLALLSAFEAAQAQDADLSPQAMEVVRENLVLVDDRFRRDPEAVGLFLRILRHPRRVATTLVRMHDVRLLDRFIPEFGRIFGRVQRDLYHAYPVDVHSLFAVQELRRLARGEYEEEFPFLTGMIRALERPDILYLAALVHDVGKGEGHSHDERGAQLALAIGDRMGLEGRDLEYLVFLVGKHLLMSETAQGRDLHDEDLIASFARRVGDTEALRMLYLLTVADIRAVGPGAWSSWKNMLLRELYDKAAEVLERGSPPAARAAERAQEVRDRVREAAGGLAPPEEVEAFLERVDHPQYLLTNPLDALLRHLGAYARRAEDPVVDLRVVPEEGYTEALVVTRDRPGLFAQIAGLMAAHRLNILSAVLNTRPDGWVLDVFHVSAPTGADAMATERWEHWRRDLAEVLRGEHSFEATVGQRLRRKPGLVRPKPRVPTRIRVDNEASRRFTVVDVRVADRIGLLYDVASALADRGLTIRLAKIATNIDQVVDSFYVETVGGGKLTEPSEIDRLRTELETRIQGEEKREK